MVEWPLPPELVLWVAQLATPLHARHAWRLLPLLRGLLFARGRRTVAAWLCAAGLGQDYKRYYYFLGALGRKTRFVASLLLRRRRRRRRPRRAHPARPGRHPHQALRATRRGRRHPPQPQPRAGRPEVPRRAHLGDHRLAGLPPALGRHRPAPARPALRPRQGRQPADDPLRGQLPHQAPDGRRVGHLGRRLAALPGESPVGGGRRGLRQATIP